FNPAFPTFDAAEFFWRMTTLGPLRAMVEPRAGVFYRPRQNVAGFLRQNYGYGQGAGRLWREAGRKSGSLPSTRAVMQAYGRRLGDAGRIARAGSDASPVRFLPLYALHLMRESAIAAGFLAASVGISS